MVSLSPEINFVLPIFVVFINCIIGKIYSMVKQVPNCLRPYSNDGILHDEGCTRSELRPPKPSKDSTKKGHHMGDYIPLEELEKSTATCNDTSVQKAAKEYADRTKIQADNVGHELLSKMGWKEGEGLGNSKTGIAAPIMAGDVKKDNLGIGAHAPEQSTKIVLLKTNASGP